MDLSAVLENTLNSKITAMLYSKLYGSKSTVAVPDSTRRAFVGQMNMGSRVSLQGAQNMKDAASLVTAAQTDVTAIKDKLNEMKKITIEAANKDAMLQPAQYEMMQTSLRSLADGIVAIAKSSSFNGINLLDGSAGMDKDGVISLQAGNSARDQVLTNMLDSSTAAGAASDGTGKLNLGNLKGLMNMANSEDAEKLLGTLNNVFDRVQSIESQYSYDIKSLNNMTVLLMGQADIMDEVVKNHAPKEEETKPTPLEEMMSGGMGGNIMNALG
ncbi:MAG: hypothetical protein RR014_02595 [Bilophila sp.]